jgi:uncharacterized damage-inducible protein DinB
VSDAVDREFNFYVTRMMQLAEAIPAERFSWRPDPQARSVSEVLVHVAVNNYALLAMLNQPVPDDLYPKIPAEAGAARQRAIFQINPKLEKANVSKADAMAIAKRGFEDAAVALKRLPESEIGRATTFVDRSTTYAGIEMRMVAHLHEHLGQLIAYARSVGVVPPWSEKRP